MCRVVQELGSKAIPVVADLEEPGSLSGIVFVASENPLPGRVVLINCAGIAELGPFLDCSDSLIERQIHLNLITPIKLAHGLLPLMLGMGGGQMINVLSIAAVQTLPQSAV